MTFGRRSFLASIGAVAGAGLLGIAPDSARAQARETQPSQPTGQDRYRKVDEIVTAAYAKDNAASVTIGIIEDANLAWSKSYGLADVENQQAANVRNLYRIGSITKQFTAIAFLQLVQKGVLHLTDPVEKFVPEINLVKERPSYSPPPTLVQLATHTSGLDREPSDTDTYTTGAVKDWDKTLIAALPHTKFLYEPGIRQSYSNVGYALLGLAIGRAAGQSYIDYATQNVLQPLGLHETQFELEPSLLPRLALGYTGANGKVSGAEAAKELQIGRGYKVPNGALFTTVEDLGRFVSFELGFGPKGILDPAFYEDVHKRIFADDGNLDGGYGIGFSQTRRGNVIVSGHGGSVAGYTSGAYYNKKASVGIIFLRNYGRGLSQGTVFDIAEVFV